MAKTIPKKIVAVVLLTFALFCLAFFYLVEGMTSQSQFLKNFFGDLGINVLAGAIIALVTAIVLEYSNWENEEKKSHLAKESISKTLKIVYTDLYSLTNQTQVHMFAEEEPEDAIEKQDEKDRREFLNRIGNGEEITISEEYADAILSGMAGNYLKKRARTLFELSLLFEPVIDAESFENIYEITEDIAKINQAIVIHKKGYLPIDTAKNEINQKTKNILLKIAQLKKKGWIML
ncbi:MAG: hypothetical protein WCX64_04985 [Candidatus Micrarchaeia archaeon]